MQRLNPPLRPSGPLEIIVTQPRRVAAVSTATRIAEERQEPLGKSVGYSIRLDSVRASAPAVQIQFCTTGARLAHSLCL